jgi:hypothetical protein
MPGSPEEAAIGATVFVGEVAEVVGRDETFDPERWIFPRQVLRFRVIDLIQTAPEDGAEFIDVLTGMGGGDCGLDAPKGSIYLIYARPGKDGSDRLETNICMRSKPAAQAEEDLKVFGRGRADAEPREPRLRGQIADLQGHALADAQIWFTSHQMRYRSDQDRLEVVAVTDSEGRFFSPLLNEEGVLVFCAEGYIPEILDPSAIQGSCALHSSLQPAARGVPPWYPAHASSSPLPETIPCL